MSIFDGLDLAGRIERLPEYLALAALDANIIRSLVNDAALARTRRWIAAGSPEPDLARLEFAGDDSVRALVVDVLRRLPAPVAWHAVEHVTWIEVGRGAQGWQGMMPTSRTPVGDQPHVIALSGAVTDEDLAPIVAHEIGHSWGAPLRSFAARVRMPEHELAARSIAAVKLTGGDTEQLVRAAVAEEAQADDLARMWGFRRHTDHTWLRRHFAARFGAATDLADQIARDIENDSRGAA